MRQGLTKTVNLKFSPYQSVTDKRGVLIIITTINSSSSSIISFIISIIIIYYYFYLSLSLFHFQKQVLCTHYNRLSNEYQQRMFCRRNKKMSTFILKRLNPCHSEIIKMPHPLQNFNQSGFLIQVVDTNSHTKWQTVQIRISWMASWSGSVLFAKAGHIWVHQNQVKWTKRVSLGGNFFKDVWWRKLSCETFMHLIKRWHGSASVAQLDAFPTGDQEVAGSTPSFVEIWSWNIFYGHSLPSADSRRAVVSFWRRNMHQSG